MARSEQMLIKVDGERAQEGEEVKRKRKGEEEGGKGSEA